MVLSNLNKLKGQTKYDGLSVKEDFTANERDLIRTKADEAREKNEQEPTDSNYVWRVRGTPKNGLYLKKLNKKSS